MVYSIRHGSYHARVYGNARVGARGYHALYERAWVIRSLSTFVSDTCTVGTNHVAYTVNYIDIYNRSYNSLSGPPQYLVTAEGRF